MIAPARPQLRRSGVSGAVSAARFQRRKHSRRYSGTCNSSRCLAFNTNPYARPNASHDTPTFTASALMPEKTASTTMIPHRGTTQCLMNDRDFRLTPKYASTEMCRNRNPLNAPKFTIEARSSRRFFMYRATASDRVAVTNMPM